MSKASRGRQWEREGRLEGADLSWIEDNFKKSWWKRKASMTTLGGAVAKSFAVILSVVLLTGISWFVMINGWGVQPQSSTVIIWGAVGQVFAGIAVHALAEIK